MLAGLIILFPFWIVAMHRISKYRHEGDAHFLASQECYHREMRFHNYQAAVKCSQDFLDWTATHEELKLW